MIEVDQPHLYLRWVRNENNELDQVISKKIAAGTFSSEGHLLTEVMLHGY